MLFAWVALFLSCVAVVYAYRAVAKQSAAIDSVLRKIDRLERSIQPPADGGREVPPRRVLATRQPAGAVEETAQTEPEWDHLPEWVETEYENDLKDVAIAVPRPDGRVDALRMRGSQGKIRGLDAVQLPKAEELLELLVEYRQLRAEYIADVLFTQRFARVFDTADEARRFAKAKMHYAVEATDDGRIGLIDLRPLNESEVVIINGERREELAADLDAMIASLVSFERKIQ